MLFGMSRTRCFGRSLLMLAIPALLLAGTMLCGMPLCGMPLCAQSQPGANGADAKSMTSAATSATGT